MAQPFFGQIYLPGGRPLGCYLYMLFCQDGEGPIYIKIGHCVSPKKRLEGLLTGCPITPHIMAHMHLPSPVIARKIENGLHRIYKKWLIRGEWFKVSFEEKPEFNRILKDMLGRLTPSGWNAKWEKIDVQIMLHEARKARRRTIAFKDKLGRAYSDFRKDCVVRDN